MIGVDEVGRGCWAGPLLVVAARETAALPDGLKDSKLLTKIERVKLVNMLSNSCDFGEGWVKAREIDSFGLAKALKLGTARALKALKANVTEEIVIDGKTNYVPKKYLYSQAIVDADNRIPVVSAASVYAKVKRDYFMTNISKKYPAYSFDKHVGYGTSLHQKLLNSYGPIKSVHRFSYKPIARLIT